MAGSEELRGYAAKCLELAHKARDPGIRAGLVQMAQSWRELAERAAEKEAKQAESVHRDE